MAAIFVSVLCLVMIHVALLLSGQVDCLDSQCGGFRHQMFSAENRALINSVIIKKTVSNHVMCGRDCHIDKNCKSFNFYKSSHYKNCKELFEAGHSKSDVYVIYPDGLSDGLEVYCDMGTDGGGWIVFQRRQDGSVDFYRTWTEYKSGFGDLSGEFWLGNDNLLTLTSDVSQGPWELRVDLYDNTETAFAKYEDFKIIGETYTLKFGTYDGSSTAGDSLKWNNGLPFSTMDNDNDKWEGNMAERHEGAWWFAGMLSHLDGKYHPIGPNDHGDGIQWNSWRPQYALSKCSMNIREVDV